jgi:lysophospholipase L1-like esterase
VIGDSITGGSDMGGIGPDGWPALVWNTMRSQGIDVAAEVSGEGSAGYVARGFYGTDFGEQAARLIAPDDRVVLFFGSRNDMPFPVDAVSDSAHKAFEDARRVAPYAVLVVIGPVWGPPNPPAAVLSIRDALARKAAEAFAVWVDPIAEGWLTTPGLIGRDGVHPTNDGHRELASRIGPIIKASLGY